jgi:hypothetical protein
MACIALSTYEAEIIAMNDATKALVGALRTIVELGLPKETAILVGDNQASLGMAHGVAKSARSKHIDIRHFYVQEQCENKIITTQYIASADNRADLNSKPHANVAYFNRLRDSLHVMDPARFRA